MKSLDEVFDLLSRERRRYALYYLERQDGPVTVEQLAETIDDWERGSDEDAFADDEFEDVILTLEHNHLPKLGSATSIEYDRENQQVRITDTDRVVSVLLSIARGIERPSSDIEALDVDELLDH